MSDQREQNPYAPPQQPPETGQRPGDAAVLARIKEMNNLSLGFGVAGLLLQVVGRGVSGALGGLMGIVGVGVFMAGLSYYARSRGQHSAFALLGLLSCLGFLILALLPKKCIVCGSDSANGRCTRCSAPVAP